jgi:hypothetical protein
MDDLALKLYLSIDKITLIDWFECIQKAAFKWQLNQ